MLFRRQQFLGQVTLAAGANIPRAAMAGPSTRYVVRNLSGQNEDIAWFEANRIQIAQQYPGQYIIIKDLAVQGAYPDFQSAYNAGVAKFGTQPFQVKQAVAEQRVENA
jgi:hypothetical protein